MAIDEIVTDSNLSMVLDASRDTRVQALSLVDQIAAAGPIESASPEAQQETSKQQKLLITNLAQLRGLHRAAYFGARQTKSQTSEARQEVDRLHLQLQNLYYEQRHLQGEISACESYESVPAEALTASRGPTPTQPPKARTMPPSSDDYYRNCYQFLASKIAQELIEFRNSHTYQKLPLLPLEEFLALKPEHADDDENTLMIARIEHERSEREALEQKRMELLKRKQKLIADNKKRKDDLANLDKELEKFIDSGRQTYSKALRQERLACTQSPFLYVSRNTEPWEIYYYGFLILFLSFGEFRDEQTLSQGEFSSYYLVRMEEYAYSGRNECTTQQVSTKLRVRGASSAFGPTSKGSPSRT
ncbi:hypothetical protein K449DRAFT_428594 [Hypoxylon sp. EC38]|nr:hypothetical protein K449DRAFT_428594 [Hypoxylon sp. EC38]